MSVEAWMHHPPDYRLKECQTILSMLAAGESISLIGLSGMGKSNLIGFLTHRAAHADPEAPICVLIDCNLLSEFSAKAFFMLARHTLTSQIQDLDLEPQPGTFEPIEGLHRALADVLIFCKKPVALLIDSFDQFAVTMDRPFFNNLRALRDAQKFKLAYLMATRRPLSSLASMEAVREFNDLFIANQMWLQPLSESDARWTLTHFAKRHTHEFSPQDVDSLLWLSGRHPGLLKTLAAIWSNVKSHDPAVVLNHPAVRRECQLLWDDLTEQTRSLLRSKPPAGDLLVQSGLVVENRIFSPVFEAFVNALDRQGIDLHRATGEVYREGALLHTELTPKEHALLSYLLEHAGAICEKDDLIRAVWPEDRVFERGVRDDSLAQLVRRLRVKIEPEPSSPIYLLTIPGRGYRLAQPPPE